MMVQKASKIGSYASYLLYKHVIDRIRESPCSQAQMAESLGMDVSHVWSIVRTLVKHKIIQRCRFEIINSGKRSVYELIKDE